MYYHKIFQGTLLEGAYGGLSIEAGQSALRLSPAVPRVSWDRHVPLSALTPRSGPFIWDTDARSTPTAACIFSLEGLIKEIVLDTGAAMPQGPVQRRFYSPDSAKWTGITHYAKDEEMVKWTNHILKGVVQAMILTMALTWFTGCASTGTSSSAPAPKRSGFLSSYELLTPIEGGDGAQSWRSQDVDWKKYNKVLIERIQIFVKEDSKNKGIDPTDMKMLTDYFYEALVKEISPSAQVVDTPGPDVIGIRIAIVDIVPTVYALSIAGTLTPYAFVAEAASGPASGRPAGSTPYLGETSIEVKFLDGGSGQLLGEFTDTRIGKKYDVDPSKSVPDAAKKWLNGYVDSFTSWSYAKRSFDQWAALFKQRFDELRGIAPEK